MVAGDRDESRLEAARRVRQGSLDLRSAPYGRARAARTRRHPIGKDTGVAPEGEGICYIGRGIRPELAELVEALADGRRGAERPKAWVLLWAVSEHHHGTHLLVR